MLGRDKAKLGLGLPPPGAVLAGSPPYSEGSSGNFGHIAVVSRNDSKSAVPSGDGVSTLCPGSAACHSLSAARLSKPGM